MEKKDALGLKEYALLDISLTFFGTSSINAITVANDPPATPPFIFTAVTLSSISASGPTRAFRVLLARKTMASDGTESNPHEGTMMAPVWRAR